MVIGCVIWRKFSTQIDWTISQSFFHIIGNSSQCPPPANANDSTVCVDNGRCHNGECNPFCEAMQNLRSCACNGKEWEENKKRDRAQILITILKRYKTVECSLS